MSVVYRYGGNVLLLLSKGAPERLLPRCTSLLLQKKSSVPITGEGERREAEVSPLGNISSMTEKMHAKIREMNRTLGSQGLRVLALAIRSLPDRENIRSEEDLPSRDDLEKDLTFVGLVGIEDPPREGVPEAVATCQRAGKRKQRFSSFSRTIQTPTFSSTKKRTNRL